MLRRTSTSNFKTSLSALIGRLRLCIRRVSDIKAPQISFGSLQSSACTPDINLASQFYTISKDSDHVVYDLCKPTTNCHQIGLSPSPVHQTTGLQGRQKGGVVREYAE